MKLKQDVCGLILSVIVPASFAGTPATTQYVDGQFTQIQSQINTINSNPAIAHPVGSCYGGGVVYYVNTTPGAGAHQHGLIVAPSNASTGAAWQTGGPTTIVTASTYFTGESNTSTILRTAGTFPAATAANDYTVTGDTCAACTSWYLPSQEELATLYAQSVSSIALGNPTFWTKCGGAAPTINTYWSSTQQTGGGPIFVWAMDNIAGYVGTFPPSDSYPVRAVRAF